MQIDCIHWRQKIFGRIHLNMLFYLKLLQLLNTEQVSQAIDDAGILYLFVVFFQLQKISQQIVSF